MVSHDLWSRTRARRPAASAVARPESNQPAGRGIAAGRSPPSPHMPRRTRSGAFRLPWEHTRRRSTFSSIAPSGREQTFHVHVSSRIEAAAAERASLTPRSARAFMPSSIRRVIPAVSGAITTPAQPQTYCEAARCGCARSGGSCGLRSARYGRTTLRSTAAMVGPRAGPGCVALRAAPLATPHRPAVPSSPGGQPDAVTHAEGLPLGDDLVGAVDMQPDEVLQPRRSCRSRPDLARSGPATATRRRRAPRSARQVSSYRRGREPARHLAGSSTAQRELSPNYAAIASR